MITTVQRPDTVRARPASPARWGPAVRFATPRVVDFLCFLLLLSGPPKLRLREASASLRGEMDAAILLRLAVWAGGLAWLLARLYPMLVERGSVPRLAAPQVLGGLLLIVLAAGTLVAPGPALTAFSVYQLAVMLGFGWVFVSLYGPEIYVRYLFWGYLLLAVAVVAAWMLAPEMVVRRGRVRGDLIAPAGDIGALGLMLCLSGAVRLKKGAFLLCVALFAVTLIASQTRTALAAFLAVLVCGSLIRSSTPIKKALPFIVAGGLVAALAGVFSVGVEFAVRETQSLSTLSQRVPLWQHLIRPMLAESPIIGLGYFSASRVLGPQYLPALGNAHSAFVEILVGGGLLGGFLFISLYGTLFLYAVRLLARGRHHPLTFAVLGLLVITFLLSITNTDGIQGGPVGFTFWSVTALLPTVWAQMRTEEIPHRRSRHAHSPRP